MRLSVIGTGYLGAVHATAMASLGFDVVGIDSDAKKIESLAAGHTPLYEPGLDELLAQTLPTGRLTFTTDYSLAADADVHFLCLGTPQQSGSYAADLTALNSAVASLAPLLDRPCLVVGKSTVPVGTAQALADEIVRLAPAGDAVDVAWNPEFLREGYAVQDTLRPDRLVFGVRTADAEQTLRKVYDATIATGTPVVVTDFPTAELVKVAANAFLATKISFINAMAEVCDATGADVTRLAEAIGHDERIGSQFLRAGIGFGGGCLPKDIRAFMARAGELGVDQALTFLREVDEVNQRRRATTRAIATDMLGGDVSGRSITVLGAAFKPDSDDVRDSPALEIAGMLHSHGANVTVTDPQAMDNARLSFPRLNYVADPDEALAGAELVLLLTEWREFRELDPQRCLELVAEPRILDGRNVLDPEAWRRAGWTYRGLGRP